jgi:Spy/CpxP family protein refolding chaperone
MRSLQIRLMRRPLMRVGLVLALAFVPAAAAAQHGGHHHGGGAPSEGHLKAQACVDEFDAVVRDGRGFGMAFAADQHGYPGPMHVLELKDRLGLSAEQEARVRAVMHAMFAESRPKGERLLEAEARLRALFAAGRADEAAVRGATAEVERARAELRLVHLLAHLKTRDMLTDPQRRAYHEARWPGRSP